MIDLNSLLDTIDHDLDDSIKYNAALRLLYSQQEGFNKPFPILHLPREIRDQIYTYCLRAAIPVNITHQHFASGVDNSPSKPPTPVLLLTNKHIYDETIELLYATNIFNFWEPGGLFAFEQQIRLENRSYVKQISICTRISFRDETVLDLGHLLRSEFKSVPSHWAVAMRTCVFEKVVHFGVNAETLGSNPLSLLSISEGLQQVIMEFLGRVPDDEVPRLSLMGFREEERQKFPGRWEVVIDQSDAYKNEMIGIEEEWEEWDEYLRNNEGLEVEAELDNEY